MKVKNISPNKIEIAGHNLCKGHILELKENEDVSPYVNAGLVEVVQ